jgi:hypothetical protein
MPTSAPRWWLDVEEPREFSVKCNIGAISARAGHCEEMGELNIEVPCPHLVDFILLA